jgi:hypothetical protein
MLFLSNSGAILRDCFWIPSARLRQARFRQMAAAEEDLAAKIAALSMEEKETLVSELSMTREKSPLRRRNLNEQTGKIFHLFATQSFHAFQPTARQLADRRPVQACGGRVQVPRGAFAITEVESRVVRTVLFSDADAASGHDSLELPILSWNVAETAVLDDIRSTLAPGCSAVTAVPLRLVRDISDMKSSDLSPLAPSPRGCFTIGDACYWFWARRTHAGA